LRLTHVTSCAHTPSVGVALLVSEGTALSPRTLPPGGHRRAPTTTHVDRYAAIAKVKKIGHTLPFIAIISECQRGLRFRCSPATSFMQLRTGIVNPSLSACMETHRPPLDRAKKQEHACMHVVIYVCTCVHTHVCVCACVWESETVCLCFAVQQRGTGGTFVGVFCLSS
jgi:hypothetical protein